MILLLAVIAGIIAGVLRAWVRKKEYHIAELEMIWLVFLAVVPQIFAFHIVRTALIIPDIVASGILIYSQIILLIFIWVNRSHPGIWVLGAGLGLNLAVILVNGGWMPISPAKVHALVPNAPIGTWLTGERLGITKDFVLPVHETHLWFLSDRFLFPNWFPWRVAFSPGDVFIAIGAFYFLWAQASPNREINH